METKFYVSLLVMVATSMLLQAMVIFSSRADELRNPPITVHIKNELSSGQVLYVHCHCTDHDLGDHYINTGVEFNWRFKPHFIRKNLWQCYLAPDKNHQAYFHVYDFKTPPYDFDLIFAAKEDGVYYRNQDNNVDEYFSKWLAN
ncbi:S-protein homolog 74 [Linum perenne]